VDFYENVVVEYLRADRSIFVNTECCIQLNDGPNPDISGLHWYCDAVAIDLRKPAVFLCEITFASQLAGLSKRLSGWNENWQEVRQSLVRDSNIESSWSVRPWIFVPEELVPKLLKKLETLTRMPPPRITTLEMVQPWKYSSWNRIGEADKPTLIPVEMQ